MLVLDLWLSPEQALEECGRRGLEARRERELAGRAGSRHWHLRVPGRPGTLELNAWENRVWVNVHPLRDGGWATALAQELSVLRAGQPWIAASPRAGATWKDLTAARPDLAAAGRRLLYGHGIGLGFLATVRADGGPRVHPICPILTESALFALIIPGPKLADLRRDPRYALHGETFPPPHQDDAFYVSGTALEVMDPAIWEQVALQMLAERPLMERWPGFESQALFEFHIERCLLTLTQAADGFPAGHTVWHAP